MVDVKKHYAYAGDRRIHYRRAGEGPPLVMVHPSPGSSFMYEGLIEKFAVDHTVIALDSPGYGESMPVAASEPSMADYAEALHDTVNALGLTRFDLYGSHTGGKACLEYAIRYPETVRRLVIDGMGVYTAEEQADMLANYTPSLEPRFDGTHLVTAWTMRRDMRMFWPWYNHTAAGRTTGILPTPDRLHADAVDFMRAGPGYWKGYHAAFKYEGLDALRRSPVPTLLITRGEDPLVDQVERIKDMPANVLIEIAPAGRESSFSDRVLEYLAGDPLPAAPSPTPVEAAVGKVRRDYVDSRVGQLLMRKSGDASKGRPLVMFHASPGSSAGMERYLLALGTDRLVITFDNPGNGDSAPIDGTPEIPDLAAVLGDAMDALGLTEYDAYGSHTGALIGIEFAIQRKDAVKHLILDGITLYNDEETRDFLANYPIPIRVSSAGDHMIWLWNMLRDMQLFWPWYNRTTEGSRGSGLASPEALQASFLEVVKGGTTFHKSYRAAFNYPTRMRLPNVQVPTLLCASPTDPLSECLPEGKQLLPAATTTLTPGGATPEAFAGTVDLYRRFLNDAPIEVKA